MLFVEEPLNCVSEDSDFISLLNHPSFAYIDDKVSLFRTYYRRTGWPPHQNLVLCWKYPYVLKEALSYSISIGEYRGSMSVFTEVCGDLDLLPELVAHDYPKQVFQVLRGITEQLVGNAYLVKIGIDADNDDKMRGYQWPRFAGGPRWMATTLLQAGAINEQRYWLLTHLYRRCSRSVHSCFGYTNLDAKSAEEASYYSLDEYLVIFGEAILPIVWPQLTSRIMPLRHS